MADAPVEGGSGTPMRPAEPWLNEIDSALQREDEWRKRAQKIVARYRDERNAESAISRVNILWSNTEVLRAALYNRTAKPDVRRRYKETSSGNDVARTSSEILERATTYSLEKTTDAAIVGAVDDMLLPGRGNVWVVYEPQIEMAEPSPDEMGGQELPLSSDGYSGRIAGQTVCLDYVYWEDFCHGLARTWATVPWVARRHTMRKADFEEKFPDAKPIPNFDAELKPASQSYPAGSVNDKFVEIWEIWDKGSKERLYVARGVINIIQADPDPLSLEGFFPCPEPLWSVMTTDTLVPVPEYNQYQDQAVELDTVSTRITALTDQLRWRGIYDGTADDGGTSSLSEVQNAADGEFKPYNRFRELREKGGIDAAFGFMPIERIPPILAQLYNQRAQLIQSIYEVTGISDIIRGSTNPTETLGAQQLKAQFGSMRMQQRQARVQAFIRDIYRIMAEIIAEHFTPEVLSDITGISLPTKVEQEMLKQQTQQAVMKAAQGQQQPSGPGMMGMPPPPSPDAMQRAAAQVPADVKKRITGPNWDDVIALLRNDKLRGYRVDIQTDATALVDDQAEKQSRLEFMKAMQELLQGAYAAASASPQMLPLIKEMYLFGIRSFKAGRALEQSFEDAFDELIANPPKPPQQAAPPLVEIEKAKQQGAMAKAQLDAQGKDKDRQIEMLRLQGEAADRQAKNAAQGEQLRLERGKLLIDGIDVLAGIVDQAQEASAIQTAQVLTPQ